MVIFQPPSFALPRGRRLPGRGPGRVARRVDGDAEESWMSTDGNGAGARWSVEMRGWEMRNAGKTMGKPWETGGFSGKTMGKP